MFCVWPSLQWLVSLYPFSLSRCVLQSGQSSAVCWCAPSVMSGSPPVIQVTPVEHWPTERILSVHLLWTLEFRQSIWCLISAKDWCFTQSPENNPTYWTTGNRILSHWQSNDTKPWGFSRLCLLFSGSFVFVVLGVNVTCARVMILREGIFIWFAITNGFCFSQWVFVVHLRPDDITFYRSHDHFLCLLHSKWRLCVKMTSSEWIDPLLSLGIIIVVHLCVYVTCNTHVCSL